MQKRKDDLIGTETGKGWVMCPNQNTFPRRFVYLEPAGKGTGAVCAPF